MGIGTAKGEGGAKATAEAAIKSPLLEASVDGAMGVLFNITGGRELSLFDVTEASQIITEAVDPNANIIFGAVIAEALEDEIRVTVIATGFEKKNPTLKNATTIKSPEAEHKPTSGVINGFNGGNEIPPWLRR